MPPPSSREEFAGRKRGRKWARRLRVEKLRPRKSDDVSPFPSPISCPSVDRVCIGNIVEEQLGLHDCAARGHTLLRLVSSLFVAVGRFSTPKISLVYIELN